MQAFVPMYERWQQSGADSRVPRRLSRGGPSPAAHLNRRVIAQDPGRGRHPSVSGVLSHMPPCRRSLPASPTTITRLVRPLCCSSCSPGYTAGEEAKSYDIPDGGLIPRQYRQTMYRSMAAAHVQIASARLPKIGTVLRDADGGFIVGPIPGIGGLFDTASFSQAWAATLRFPGDDHELRESLPPSLVDEIVRGLDEFPARLAELAPSGRYFASAGLFPIPHADLFHTNVIVDKNFDLLGIIDWEGACTVPWELMDTPAFLGTVPRLLNPPEQYDKRGRPLDPHEAARWAEEENYATMVEEAERQAGADDRLSSVLIDKDARDLACTMHLFVLGKLGFYERVLDCFERK
ncbi:hypothetical protein VTK73DRAFT_9884 [Phialemonium thermophilum]|uniref:Aminoglycoside phosphotransferase domain-containing protein n=1 Tax=Phialemonium thermophilum TaxID=223376 RepID=A0ABR3VZP5_9PEZI